MLKTLLYGWILLLSLSGCASNVPVAASCPPPPPVPSVLLKPPSAGPSYSESWNNWMNEVRDLLNKLTEPD